MTPATFDTLMAQVVSQYYTPEPDAYKAALWYHFQKIEDSVFQRAYEILAKSHADKYVPNVAQWTDYVRRAKEALGIKEASYSPPAQYFNAPAAPLKPEHIAFLRDLFAADDMVDWNAPPDKIIGQLMSFWKSGALKVRNRQGNGIASFIANLRPLAGPDDTGKPLDPKRHAPEVEAAIAHVDATRQLIKEMGPTRNKPLPKDAAKTKQEPQIHTEAPPAALERNDKAGGAISEADAKKLGVPF